MEGAFSKTSIPWPITLDSAARDRTLGGIEVQIEEGCLPPACSRPKETDPRSILDQLQEWYGRWHGIGAFGWVFMKYKGSPDLPVALAAVGGTVAASYGH